MSQRFEDAFGDETEVDVVTHKAGPLRGQALIALTVTEGYAVTATAAYTPATARRVAAALTQAADSIDPPRRGKRAVSLPGVCMIPDCYCSGEEHP